MPSPKDGETQTIVPPAEPTAPHDADQADPGEVQQAMAQQRQTQTGKYGSQDVTPFQPPESAEDKKAKPHWIEIALVDQDGQAVPGEAYRVALPDGSVAEGTVDEHGAARIDGIPSGNCKITFPKLDKEAWSKG